MKHIKIASEPQALACAVMIHSIIVQKIGKSFNLAYDACGQASSDKSAKSP